MSWVREPRKRKQAYLALAYLVIALHVYLPNHRRKTTVLTTHRLYWRVCKHPNRRVAVIQAFVPSVGGKKKKTPKTCVKKSKRPAPLPSPYSAQGT